MIFRYNKSFILNVDDPKDMPVLIIPTRLNLVSFIKNQSWIIATVAWHHRLSAHESEQTPGDSEGQGSLARCSPWVTVGHN